MDSEELVRLWAMYARRVPSQAVVRTFVVMKVEEPPALPPPPSAGLEAPTERVTIRSSTVRDSDDS